MSVSWLSNLKTQRCWVIHCFWNERKFWKSRRTLIITFVFGCEPRAFCACPLHLLWGVGAGVCWADWTPRATMTCWPHSLSCDLDSRRMTLSHDDRSFVSRCFGLPRPAHVCWSNRYLVGVHWVAVLRCSEYFQETRRTLILRHEKLRCRALTDLRLVGASCSWTGLLGTAMNNTGQSMELVCPWRMGKDREKTCAPRGRGKNSVRNVTRLREGCRNRIFLCWIWIGP